MSIFNNLKLAHLAIVRDQTQHSIMPDPNNPNSGKLGAEFNKMAVEALTAGIGSQAWTDYMKHFASNQKELDRLADKNMTPNDGWLRQQRAYIVSNSICDTGTQGKTTEKVDDGINLSAADSLPDDVFIATRRFVIPPV